MNKKIDKALKELQVLTDACSQPLRLMSDQELREEAAHDGIDFKQAADDVQRAIDNALRVHQREKLVEARREYDSATKALARGARLVQVSLQQKLSILSECIARYSYVEGALFTAQHRDFHSLTEADVDSMLSQLQALGLLDDKLDKEDKS